MSCPSGKRRWVSDSRAVLEAWRAECRGVPCTIYRCPNCGGFHITSQRPGRNGGPLNRAATRKL